MIFCYTQITVFDLTITGEVSSCNRWEKVQRTDRDNIKTEKGKEVQNLEPTALKEMLPSKPSQQSSGNTM